MEEASSRRRQRGFPLGWGGRFRGQGGLPARGARHRCVSRRLPHGVPAQASVWTWADAGRLRGRGVEVGLERQVGEFGGF